MKGKLRFMWRATLALVLVLSLGVVMAAPVSAAGALTGVTAVPANTMAGATTTYTITSITATAGDIASVDMTFASGFDVSSAALSGTVTGLTAGTVGVSGQVVTYTVTTPATISASTTIIIVLSGIVNPAAATYSPAVTITTKNLAGGAIDTGSDDVTITAAPVSFAVVTQGTGTQTAGTAFSVTITALESDGTTTETDYAGAHLIDFTSTATGATIPAFEVVTFTSGVGTTTVSFVLNVVETGKTITATDSVLSVSGTSDPITVNLAGVGYLAITGAPTSVTAGVPFTGDITVTAYDAEGNVMTTNTSQVVWTSNDGSATLPSAQSLVLGTYTFTGGDFTLQTAGLLQTITATAGGADARSATIIVNPAAASKLDVGAATDPIVADGYASSVITAEVWDEFDNTVIASTAAITFETSVGGFTEASGASTYIKNAVLGVATPATLTSTDGGTATVKVTSGSLTYDTVAVTLTASAAPTEVWVSLAYSSDVLDGGHDWATDAFATIEEGTDAVAAGGTVNVAAGTYVLGNTIDIATAGITLQSTGTTAATIINADALTSGGLDGSAILVNAAAVTVDGFTVDDASACGIYLQNADDSIIRDNVITNVYMLGGIDVSVLATGVMVSGNELDEFSPMMLHGSDCTVSGNTFETFINFWAENTTLEGVTITGNQFPAHATETYNFAILLRGDSGAATINDTLIDGNTITGRKNGGILIGADSTGGLTVTNLTITGNTITNHGDASGSEDSGIRIYADAVWGAGNTISNNNITGNQDYGILNEDTAVVNAENNWWGDATGPYHATTNSAARGDIVSSTVDYTPWLTAAYAMPADPVTSATISLVSGWNLISLPIMPTSSAIATVLADLITDETVDEVRTYDQGDWDNWASTGPAGDLTIMADGAGYWIYMNAADSLVVAGSELPTPPATPPSYSVYTGWNMIGFKSVDTDTTVAAYLGTMVAGTLEAIYGYDAAASAYFIPGVTTGHLKLEPGCGYWLAVNANGTIYP